MEREKQTPTLPHGVSPIVRSFLLDCISYGAVSELMRPPRQTEYFYPERNRNIIGLYYGSEATAYELAEMYGISRNRVTQIIKEGMLKMRDALPDEIRDKYSEEEILKMKTGHSQRTRERFSRARKGIPSPFRERKLPPEQIERNRQRSLELWQDPAFRERTLRRQEEYRRERYGETKKEQPKDELEKKLKPRKKSLRERSNPNRNGIIFLPEISLQNLVKEFIAREAKKNSPVTVEDVCKHLRYMGVSFDPRTILEMVKE